ncbi:hypothetical protein CHITON_1721 [Thermococcus chitonophagus]|uniref:Uncharacterized protein n=2 Tax=Thermococcus chitonophagus TaxID=54262 RepID=A0A160VU39_9EURY|nr:hypothetical protein CHITON_1721 [Thermococcus chitonophagus]
MKYTGGELGVSDESIENIVKIYTIFGGIPYYLDITRGLKPKEAIKEKVL